MRVDMGGGGLGGVKNVKGRDKKRNLVGRGGRYWKEKG